MKVKLFALLREITGLKETDAFQGATVRELLESLCAKYGRKLEEWVFAPHEAHDPRSLSGNVIILVNGRAIEHLAGLETPLKPTDEVAIFPKLAGG